MAFSDFLQSKKSLSFDDFLLTKIAEQCSVGRDWFSPGEVKEVLVYEGSYFIFVLLGGDYCLTADRAMIISGYLEKLELMLYCDVCDEDSCWSY